MPFGAEIRANGVRFRLWAPDAANIRVLLADRREPPLLLTVVDGGWHELVTDAAGPGSRYTFLLPDATTVPDPASRFQPDDVHGPSEVIDPAGFAWHDDTWIGRPWNEAVIYELHMGAFTPEGTFHAAATHLAHLAQLGITAVEIMPVGDFSGGRNWGYDGVLPYAPDSTYGRPDDFKRFIETAHALGIMVLLDVVYNHFGPDGNYLPRYASSVFTNRHKTPWGDAINYDGPDSATVRAFVIENALYWLEEYHLDGLRLDAVHAIVDNSVRHLLDELAERVASKTVGRCVHLLLENEDNQARRLERRSDGTPATYTAQWNDDVHHALHTAATGEDVGYYADYRSDSAKLGRALAEGFAYQGDRMPYRNAPRGEPSAGLPPAAFVAFIQNHDQIGNRAFGERLNAIAPPEAVRAAAAVYLLLPQIPMLFMGEEWAATQPFPYFCGFSGDLAQAVSKGRREEFARFPAFADARAREKIPDPEGEATFASAKLDWSARTREPHAEWLAWYRRILEVRRRVVVPLIPCLWNGGSFEVLGDGAVEIRWRSDTGAIVDLLANLSAATVPAVTFPKGLVFWSEGDARNGMLGPWSVRWSMLTPPRRYT